MTWKAHYVRQGSDEWHALRRVRLTASDMGPWLTTAKPTAKQVETRQKAICRLLAARRNCDTAPNGFCSWDMQRGLDFEPVARQAFEEAHKLPVDTSVGFCESLEGCFGCSPDGLLDDCGTSAGLEIKVLSPHTHLHHLLYDPTIPDEYRFQIHASLAVTGFSEWHYWAWNPGLPPLHIVQQRDSFTEELHRALIAFSREVDAAHDRLTLMRGERTAAEMVSTTLRNEVTEIVYAQESLI